MLGCNAYIFGRQTSTGIFLDQAAPVTGGGKGMSEGMGGRVGWRLALKLFIHFTSLLLTLPNLPLL